MLCLDMRGYYRTVEACTWQVFSAIAVLFPVSMGPKYVSHKKGNTVVYENEPVVRSLLGDSTRSAPCFSVPAKRNTRNRIPKYLKTIVVNRVAKRRGGVIRRAVFTAKRHKPNKQ